MGVVWKARDNERGKIVCDKDAARPPRLTTPSTSSGSRREVDLARFRPLVAHRPGSLGTALGMCAPFVVLEFGGRSLASDSHLRGRSISTGRGSRLARSDCRGSPSPSMRLGIVHRDVKALRTSCLTEDGVAKLTDFWDCSRR